MVGFVFTVIGLTIIGLMIYSFGWGIFMFGAYCTQKFPKAGLTGPPEFAWPFNGRNHGKMSVKRFRP